MTVVIGRKGVFAYAAYSLPVTGAGKGVVHRAAATIHTVADTEEEAKQRIVAYLRALKVKTLGTWRECSSMADYSGRKGAATQPRPSFAKPASAPATSALSRSAALRKPPLQNREKPVVAREKKEVRREVKKIDWSDVD